MRNIILLTMLSIGLTACAPDTCSTASLDYYKHYKQCMYEQAQETYSNCASFNHVSNQPITKEELTGCEDVFMEQLLLIKDLNE